MVIVVRLKELNDKKRDSQSSSDFTSSLPFPSSSCFVEV